MEPFFNKLDLDKARWESYDRLEERRVKDIRDCFKETANLSEQQLETVAYQVYQIDVKPEPGAIQHSITVIKPGNVNGECHMTKGHYHANDQSAEIYMGLKGDGLLLMQKGEEVRLVEMKRGVVAYIPPEWAHRTINVGDDEFVFMSYFPGDAGYDYQSFLDEGVRTRIYKTDTGYEKVSD